MIQKSLKRNAFFSVTKTLMSLIFPLITFPYASRILMPEGIGRANFAHSIVSYFALIAALGIGNYGIREGAKLRGDKEKLSAFTQELFSLNMISTAVAYVLFAAALVFVPKLAEYRALLCVYGATIIFTTLGMDWLYGALEEFGYIAARSVVFQFISLILLFVMVRTKDDYLRYAAVSVFSSVGSNVCNFVHARKYVSFNPKLRMNLRKRFKDALVMFAIALSTSVYCVLDSSMLGFIAGDRSVGIYTAANKIIRIIISVIASALAVLMPRLSFYVENGETEKLRRTFQKALIFTLGLAAPVTAAVFLLAEPVILLCAGRDYLDAVIVMKIMSPAAFMITLGNLFGLQLLMPLGKEKRALVSYISAACANFCLNLVLIPRFGAIGAAAATVFTETIVASVQCVFSRAFIDFKYAAKNLVQYALAAAVMCAPILVILRFINGAIPRLCLSFVLGSLAYFASLAAMKNDLAAYILLLAKSRKRGAP